MGKTISFAKGKGNIRHNNRDFFTDNIDRDRTPNNITYVKQDLEAAYDEIFGQALQDYNAKQKRSDRKIESYLEHIRKSKNGEQLFHEVIVQLGDKDDSGFGTSDFSRCRAVLDRYMDNFQERNPHIHVFNAVMHLDESTPHLHISFIPVAKDYKRGLSVRNSLSKSMEIFANENQKVGILGWYEQERQILKEYAKDLDIEISQKNERRPHLSLSEYKEVREEIKTLEKAKNDVKKQINQLAQENLEPLKNIKEFDNHYTPNVILGRVSEKEYQKLKDVTLKYYVENANLKSRIPDLESRLKNSNLYYERENQRNVELVKELKEVKSELAKIKEEKSDVEWEFSNYKRKVEAFRKSAVFFREVVESFLHSRGWVDKFNVFLEERKRERDKEQEPKKTKRIIRSKSKDRGMER